MHLDNVGLGCVAVEGLIKKTKINPEWIDEIVWGTVVLNTKAPNVAREIVIDLNLPKTIPGHTVSRACLSGLTAILSGIRMIETGQADCIIAGGSDSTSNGEVTLPKHLQHALAKYQYGGNKLGLQGIRNLLSDAGPISGWGLDAPGINERSTGKAMGYHADTMAQIHHITREAQDQFAMRSHINAAKARKEGYLADEITPIVLPNGKKIDSDSFIRAKQDPEKLKKLKTAFRQENGTITAATASPLTDGASAVLLMSEAFAKKHGYPIDCSIKSYATTAIDPYPQLLLAPAVAIPRALEKANMNVEDVDLFEIHEAFAAQVLATIQVLESDSFAREYLKKDRAVTTKFPRDRVNPNGSSIAVGHPFAATGGRMVIAACNELRRSNKKTALLSVCAAGGLGGVAIIERQDPSDDVEE
eukprot:CAMPEP_0117430056 /NCGR_PEP_ID=MMETSP0758-20121206/9581_1 /TAXON_ID=63605 /ORGANISM="Percolomonas cosmopolitus, Strain AE-1 (ATCC 50343)" /LENGTH=416 /DNA_ID=CAMNT_0005217665 /DNA_START=164 /DNA_END=1411 /DNA_ORIENTATION=+